MDVTGVPTSSTATMTVTDIVTGPPASLFSGCTTGRVLVQVLSGAINFTLDSPATTPTAADFVAYAGDFFSVEPAKNLRMVRNVTSACCKFQVFQ